MSILIGIRNEHASGSTTSSEGYGGVSIDTNSIHIIKEGTYDELKKYADDALINAKRASKILFDMENEYGKYSDLTENEWERLYEKELKKVSINSFSKLIILEGIVLK